MSVPPVVLLEARLRREVPVPAGERVTITGGTRPGVAWEASWGLDGLAWSGKDIDECNDAAHWRVADDGEGGLVVVTSRSGKDVEAALRRRSGRRPPQLRVQPGQLWADRTASGRLIMITDPDDNGRVRYKTITIAAARRSGKSWGRINRQSLLSAYRLLPPEHPAYEELRRDIEVRYPRRWQTGFPGPWVTAWFEDDDGGTADLAAWLASEAAWVAFRDWAFATEEERHAASSVGLRVPRARGVQGKQVRAVRGAAAHLRRRHLGQPGVPGVEATREAGVGAGEPAGVLRRRRRPPGGRVEAGRGRAPEVGDLQPEGRRGQFPVH